MSTLSETVLNQIYQFKPEWEINPSLIQSTLGFKENQEAILYRIGKNNPMVKQDFVIHKQMDNKWELITGSTIDSLIPKSIDENYNHYFESTSIYGSDVYSYFYKWTGIFGVTHIVSNESGSMYFENEDEFNKAIEYMKTYAKSKTKEELDSDFRYTWDSSFQMNREECWCSGEWKEMIEKHTEWYDKALSTATRFYGKPRYPRDFEDWKSNYIRVYLEGEHQFSCETCQASGLSINQMMHCIHSECLKVITTTVEDDPTDFYVERKCYDVCMSCYQKGNLSHPHELVTGEKALEPYKTILFNDSAAS